MNFSEAIARGNGQNLEETTNQNKEATVNMMTSRTILELSSHEDEASHTSSKIFLAPLLSPSSRWATPRSFFRLMSSGKI